jgi:hypothetical protein
MLAASFPTLRQTAWTCAVRSGPAAEPASGVSTSGLSGEASQPGSCAPAGTLPPNPAGTLLRSVASGPLPQGRHRMFQSRSFALRHGSCLLPLKLRSLSQADEAVFGPSRCSDLIASPWSSPASRRLPLGSLNPRRSPSLFTCRLRHRQDSAALFCSSRTAGWWTTTLAHSSNCRFSPTVFAPISETPDPGA